jgi:hypothetical protein
MGVADSARKVAGGIIRVPNFLRVDEQMKARKHFAGRDQSTIPPSVQKLLDQNEWSAAIQEDLSYTQMISPIVRPRPKDAPSSLPGSSATAEAAKEAAKPKSSKLKTAAKYGGPILAAAAAQRFITEKIKSGNMSTEEKLEEMQLRRGQGEEQVDPVKRINDQFSKQLGRGRNGLR